MLNKLPFYLLLIFLMSCSSDKKQFNAGKHKTLNAVYQAKHTCQIFEPKDAAYSFSAKVLDVRKIYKYNTREMRNFPVTRIVASIVRVSRGKEMLTDQAIFIDLAPQRQRCIVGEICNFVAPRALKSDTTETIQVLDAMIVIGN